MSLVTLTFGDGRYNEMSIANKNFASPFAVKMDPLVENRLKVIKVTTFFGSPEVFIIGEVESGVVGKDMLGAINGMEFRVTEIECKIRNSPVAKKGMTVGVTTQNVDASMIEQGSVITFLPQGTGFRSPAATN